MPEPEYTDEDIRAAAASSLQEKQRQAEEEERAMFELPRIRTYASDMSRAIKARGESLASIVNKEQTREQKNTQTQTTSALTPRRILLIAGTAVLILAGLGVFIGSVLFSPSDEVTTLNTGIIFTNEVFTISTQGNAGPLIDQLADIRERENLLLGEIMRVDLIENGTPIVGAELADRLSLPSALAREVGEVMVGIHAFDRNQPFIILRVGTYDRSFGAMLGWERDMARALGDFFAPVDASQSTPPPLTFTDEVVRNVDVRRSEESWPILYTFLQQDLLVITTNEFTLREITTRLGAVQNSF